MKNKDLDNIKNNIYNSFMELYIHLDAEGKSIIHDVIESMYIEIVQKSTDIDNSKNEHEIKMRNFLEKHIGPDFSSKFINQYLVSILNDIFNDTNKELIMYEIIGVNPTNKTAWIKIRNCSTVTEVPLISIKGIESLKIKTWYIAVKDDEKDIIEYTSIKVENFLRR